MPEAAGDVGGGLAAVVLEVERGAVLDERLHRGVDVVDAGGRVIARRPHQRGEAVGVAAVDVDARGDQELDDRRVAVAGGVDDRALAVVVERVGVGAELEQQFDASRRTVEGGGGERAYALPARKVGIGAPVEEQADHRAAIRSAA